MRLVTTFARLLCVEYRAPPSYTVHRVNAARFGAMNVGVLCDPLLCCPPSYTAHRVKGARFGAMGVGVLCDPLL